MLRLFFSILLMTILVLLSGCARYSGCTDILASNFEPDADVDDGSCEYDFGSGGNFNLTVYNNQSSVGVITVYVGNTSGEITVTSVASQCGESGCANFSLASGTYSLSASATTGETWSGDVTVSNGQCTLLPLY